MLPPEAISASIDSTIAMLIGELRTLPLDMTQMEIECTVYNHVNALYRFVATVTRSIERAEHEEQRFLDHVRSLDTIGHTAH